MKDGPAIIETLSLCEKADLNVKDHELRSPLARVASERHPSQIIDCLLSLDKVDVNTRDLYGRTPLILAVIMRNQDHVNALIQCNRVDIDAQDDDGRTALSWAIGPVNFLFGQYRTVSARGCYWNDEHVPIAVLLKQRAPNHDLADNWGHTPKWWARVHGIVLLELAGDSWRVPYLEWLLENSFSGYFGLELNESIFELEPTESMSIKAEMQSFLEGEHIMKSPCQWNLNYCHVTFGGNWILRGTTFSEEAFPSGYKLY